MTAARSDLMALKPCPFCRSEGLTLLRGYRYADDAPDRKENAVMCPTCEARAPEKSWNDRLAASQPDRASVVVALEKIKSGSFDGASTLAVSGAWQLFAERLQKIAAEALLSGAGTKSDGRTRDSLSSEENEPVVTRACGPSDPSPGPVKPAPIADSSEAGRGGDPLDDLVARFSAALLAKLKAARVKYGYDEGWREPGWEADCQKHLIAHLAKGDPRDVAAYCAFMWHHGWSTVAPALSAPVGEPYAYAKQIGSDIVRTHSLKHMMPEARAEYTIPLYTHPPAPAVGEILATLREHHNWHLQAGTIGLQDGEGGWIEIDNGAEYSDSALYERTAKLLEGAPPEELQPIPRGGMNTWWWEQAVLLRRKVRALEKTQTAPAVGADVRVSKNDDFLTQARKTTQLLDEAAAALTRPLGGFVQGSIADGGQCNEQSGKQLSPAWRPIESAPKDGRYIIAGYFRRGDELLWVKQTRWMTAEQAAESDGGSDPSDYDCGWTDGEDEDDYSATPTHWMPLPAPPAVAETDADAQRDDGLLSGATSDPINP